MMKHLIVFCAILFMPLHVMAAQGGASAKAVFNDMDSYCMGALKAGKTIESFAVEKKLPEISPEDARKFSPDGGKVFALPNVNGAAVLTTNPQFKTVCSIAIHKTDIQTYKAALYSFFSSSKGFRLMKEKRDDAHKITKTEFAGDINGAVKILVTASDAPRPNGIQILMTIGRVNE